MEFLLIWVSILPHLGQSFSDTNMLVTISSRRLVIPVDMIPMTSEVVETTVTITVFNVFILISDDCQI